MLEQVASALMTLDEFMMEYHKQPFELINDERQILTGGDVMPGLEIKLNDLFQ